MYIQLQTEGFKQSLLILFSTNLNLNSIKIKKYHMGPFTTNS